MHHQHISAAVLSQVRRLTAERCRNLAMPKFDEAARGKALAIVKTLARAKLKVVTEVVALGEVKKLSELPTD